MSKLYWATEKDALHWHGCESREEAIAEARSWGMGFEGEVQSIWIAPIDAELDSDAGFWDACALYLLRDLEGLNDFLAEDGWADPEEGAFPFQVFDRDGILAGALEKVLGPRPRWRTVDTSKAERVDL